MRQFVHYDPADGGIIWSKTTDDDSFEPDLPADEYIEVTPGTDTKYKKVDTATDSLVDDKPDEFADHGGHVHQRTIDIIGQKYKAAGSNALTADDAIQANANIPQEVKDFATAMIQMQYLTYVAMTGDRIESVEDDYFPVE